MTLSLAVTDTNMQLAEKLKIEATASEKKVAATVREKRRLDFS